MNFSLPGYPATCRSHVWRYLKEKENIWKFEFSKIAFESAQAAIKVLTLAN